MTESTMQRRENVDFNQFCEYLSSLTPESWAKIAQEYQQSAGNSSNPPSQIQSVAQNIHQSGQNVTLNRLFTALAQNVTGSQGQAQAGGSTRSISNP